MWLRILGIIIAYTYEWVLFFCRLCRYIKLSASIISSSSFETKPAVMPNENPETGRIWPEYSSNCYLSRFFVFAISFFGISIISSKNSSPPIRKIKLHHSIYYFRHLQRCSNWFCNFGKQMLNVFRTVGMLIYFHIFSVFTVS